MKNIPKETPDKEYLDEVLDYNPNTGDFFWKVRGTHLFSKGNTRVNAWNGRFAGTKAGSIHALPTGCGTYILISLLGRRWAGQRLAWKIMTGSEPPDKIDHFDGDGTNNIWSNLRDGSGAINYRNMKMKSNNTSGHNGVHWESVRECWKSQGYREGTHYDLGCYIDINDAVDARKRWEMNIGGFTDRHGTKNQID